MSPLHYGSSEKNKFKLRPRLLRYMEFPTSGPQPLLLLAHPSPTSTTQLAAFHPAGLSPSQTSNPNPSRVQRNDHFLALLLKALETLLDTYLKAHGLVLIPFGLLSGLFCLYLPLEAGCPVLDPLLSPSTQSSWEFTNAQALPLHHSLCSWCQNLYF